MIDQKDEPGYDHKAAEEWLDGYIAGTHVHPSRSACIAIRDTLAFLRKQSRGHFEAMTVVLRDGIEAITPDPSDLKPPAPKKAN